MFLCCFQCAAEACSTTTKASLQPPADGPGNSNSAKLTGTNSIQGEETPVPKPQFPPPLPHCSVSGWGQVTSAATKDLKTTGGSVYFPI